jgi:hypothetical protein
VRNIDSAKQWFDILAEQTATDEVKRWRVHLAHFSQTLLLLQLVYLLG